MYFIPVLISTVTNWVHASVCVCVKIDKVNHYVEFSLYITFADAWVAANMTVCKKHQSIQIIRVQSQSSLKPLWLWIKAAVQDIKNATSLTHTTQYIWFYIKGWMTHRILNKHTSGIIHSLIVNSSLYLDFVNVFVSTSSTVTNTLHHNNTMLQKLPVSVFRWSEMGSFRNMLLLWCSVFLTIVKVLINTVDKTYLKSPSRIYVI